LIGSRQPGRFRRLGGGAKGMRAHVSDTRSLRGRPDGRHRGRSTHPASGAARDDAPPDFLSGAELTASEGPRPRYRVTRPVLCRSLRLEESQDSLSTICSPTRHGATIGLAQRLRRSHTSIV
jgi:hypothetical protein